MPSEAPSNEEIADVLARIGTLLEVQAENPHRIAAYRNGASAVSSASASVAGIARDEGREGLEKLPFIGSGLAGVIEEYVRRGRSSLLKEL